MSKLNTFCWLMSEVQLMIERIDDLKRTPAYNHELKLRANHFLKVLEAFNLKIYKKMGGADDVERGMHAITTIVEQQQEIRQAIDINNVEELMLVQAYQMELLEALKDSTNAKIITPAAEIKVA